VSKKLRNREPVGAEAGEAKLIGEASVAQGLNAAVRKAEVAAAVVTHGSPDQRRVAENFQ